MLIDGLAEQRVPVNDRGLAYGDGLFETIALADGGPCLWERHLQRLAAGCQRLGIAAPPPGLLLQEAARVIGQQREGVLKITVTRGSGGRGYRPDPKASPRRILQWLPAPDHPPAWASQGIRARFCSTPLGCNPLLAGLKHLNRLEQVLARSEWLDPDIAEGLMLDSQGHVIEGTMSNLFIERAGQLLSPSLQQSGVAGVMRGLVLEQAQAMAIPCELAPLQRREVEQADALFVTNSLIGLWPIRQLEDRSYALGALTCRLKAALAPEALAQPSWRALEVLAHEQSGATSS